MWPRARGKQNVVLVVVAGVCGLCRGVGVWAACAPMRPSSCVCLREFVSLRACSWVFICVVVGWLCGWLRLLR